jgi:Glycosyl transferase family 90
MTATMGRRRHKVFYYLKNLARDAAPQAYFRCKLDGILSDVGLYDPAYIGDRVRYYNKLGAPFSLPEEACTVSRIPKGSSMYYYDLKEHARYFPSSNRLCHFFGDRRESPPSPSFAKSRLIEGKNENSVILKLNKFRHFFFPEDPIAFDRKLGAAVWRGGGHGKQRQNLIRLAKGNPLLNVADAGTRSGTRYYLSPRDQMRYRYIISLEGRDVATNLKWIMASKSLCLMPKPTCETWYQEGRLVAGEHYAEIAADMSDLNEVISYFNDHPREAADIVANANAFANQYKDERRERLISLLVLYRYFVLSGQMAPEAGLDDFIQPESLPAC